MKFERRKFSEYNQSNIKIKSVLYVKVKSKSYFYLKLPIKYIFNKNVVKGRVDETKLIVIVLLISVFISFMFSVAYQFEYGFIFTSFIFGGISYLILRGKIKKALNNFLKQL